MQCIFEFAIKDFSAVSHTADSFSENSVPRAIAVMSSASIVRSDGLSTTVVTRFLPGCGTECPTGNRTVGKRAVEHVGGIAVERAQHAVFGRIGGKHEFAGVLSRKNRTALRTVHPQVVDGVVRETEKVEAPVGKEGVEKVFVASDVVYSEMAYFALR